jgi:hypothetical protein
VTIRGFGVAAIGRAPGGIAWRPISDFLRLETITVPTHCIDFNRLEVYEAGALLVTLLAYPGESRHDDEQRSRLHASLCACVLQAAYATDPDWSISPQLAKPFSSFVARHDLLRQAGVELVRTLLPTAKGIRLLGVTVSNFDERPAGVADELPLFAGEAVIAPPPDTVPAVPVTGGLCSRTASSGSSSPRSSPSRCRRTGARGS